MNNRRGELLGMTRLFRHCVSLMRVRRPCLARELAETIERSRLVRRRRTCAVCWDTWCEYEMLDSQERHRANAYMWLQHHCNVLFYPDGIRNIIARQYVLSAELLLLRIFRRTYVCEIMVSDAAKQNGNPWRVRSRLILHQPTTLLL
jgi:hypothetical protein